MICDEVIYFYIMVNVYVVFEEKDKGSLMFGKLVDIVILSNDLL